MLATTNSALTISGLDWISDLDAFRAASNYRKTSIICTIGPKTMTTEALANLRKAGMNIVRLNLSHGDHEYHGQVVKNTRESFKVHPGRDVAIALDTKGPEIRTGFSESGQITITAGTDIVLTNEDKYKNAMDESHIFIDYSHLAESLEAGKLVYIDDGNLTLEVVGKMDGKNVKCRARNTHILTNRKNVNLPDTDVMLPALSAKDKSDLKFAVDQGLDFVFASFVRSADNVKAIRKELGEKGKHIQIISKIENAQGVKNFDEILAETDGVMVARGDLGMEIPIEKVFIAQKMMIAKCNAAGKPVICATQMLESMTNNPRPTRAEVSDVANAVLDGADCVMLSGETAKGSYPIEAVRTMADTCREAESCICYPLLTSQLRCHIRNTGAPVQKVETIGIGAVNATHDDPSISGILVLTTTGETARIVSKYKPRVPIIVVTRSEHVARKCHLYRGTYPLHYRDTKPGSEISADAWQDNVDERVKWAIEESIKAGVVPRNSFVIAIQGWRGGAGKTNTMRIVSTTLQEVPKRNSTS